MKSSTVAFRDSQDLARLKPSEDKEVCSLVFIARFALSAGGGAQAEKSIDKALAVEPGNANLLLIKGDILAKLGKTAEALATYDGALRLQPLLASAWTAKGSVMASAGDLLGALCCLNAGLEIEPNRVAAWHNKGAVLEMLGQHRLALRCYDIVLRIDPRERLTTYQRGHLYEELGRDPNEGAQQRITERRLGPQNDISGDPSALEALGSVYAESARYDDALACFDKCLEIEPDRINAMYHKAACLEALGRLTEAHRVLLEICRRDPNLPEAKLMLDRTGPQISAELAIRAHELASTGKFAEANEVLDGALKITETSGLIWTLKAICEFELVGPERALASADRAIECDSSLALSWRTRARALRDLGEVALSDEAFLRCLSLQPDDALSWNDRGILLANMGRFAEATSCLKRATEIMPIHPLHWVNLGSALCQLGDYADARSAVERAIALDPTNHSAWYMLGAIAYSTKQYEESSRYLQKCLEISPGFDPALDFLSRTSSRRKS
jgi:tetratricopeptide (TPR) repeat protein